MNHTIIALKVEAPRGRQADPAALEQDLPLLADLSQLMCDASAPNRLDCVARYFPHEMANWNSRP